MLDSFWNCFVVFRCRIQAFISWEEGEKQAKDHQRLQHNFHFRAFTYSHLFSLVLALPNFAFLGIMISRILRYLFRYSLNNLMPRWGIFLPAQ